jgi:hypothetical protein
MLARQALEAADQFTPKAVTIAGVVDDLIRAVSAYVRAVTTDPETRQRPWFDSDSLLGLKGRMKRAADAEPPEGVRCYEVPHRHTTTARKGNLDVLPWGMAPYVANTGHFAWASEAKVIEAIEFYEALKAHASTELAREERIIRRAATLIWGEGYIPDGEIVRASRPRELIDTNYTFDATALEVLLDLAERGVPGAS